MPAAPRPLSERTLVTLIGAVQFINVLEFVMVMPLGPDFGRALAIPSSKLGLVNFAYTGAAAFSGVLGSLFLERFDRRRALGVAIAGLMLGTAAGGFALGLGSLMTARVLAGLFGGPATSLANSIIADRIPAERRGQALGAVMGAFSLASIIGVPACLELSRLGGWRLPFFVVAGLGLVVIGGVFTLLPPMREHLAGRGDAPPPFAALRGLLGRRAVRLSYAMTATVMCAGFMLIPSLPPYLVENLRFPRPHLGTLYLVGGLVSFLAMRVGGFLVDRFGSFRTGTFAMVGTLLVHGLLFVFTPPGVPLVPLFMGFMLFLALRNVAYNTLTSKVPSPYERARFASIQSAVQHLASGAGVLIAAAILTERPDRTLVHMREVALLAMGLGLSIPLLMRLVEREVTAG